MKFLMAAIMISFILLSSFAGLQFVEVAMANPIPPQQPMAITLFPSQKQYYNSSFVYNIHDIPVDITIQLASYAVLNMEKMDWLNYSLDGQEAIPLVVTYPQPSGPQYNATATATVFVASSGLHNLVVQGETNFDQFVYASINFTLHFPTQTPSPNPTSSPVYIGLSESASALNYGETVNFTASPPEGGTSPFTFTWYVDNQQLQVVQSNDSYYFSTNTLPVGSHHVYVEVKDANGSIATTNTVEFNVLPASSSSPSATQEPSATPSLPEGNLTAATVIAGAVVTIVFFIGLLAYAVKRRQSRRSS